MTESNALIKCLDAKDVQAYMAKVVKNERLFLLIRESFQLKIDHTRGLMKSELPALIESIPDPDLKKTLKGIQLLGESRANLTIDNKTGTHYRKALVANVPRQDGKYDILVVYATQTKELAYDKLAACGVGAACAGILAGFLTMSPAIGITTGVAVSSASGMKGAYDYSKPMPDVLCGYMLKELVRRKIFTLLPNNDVQLALN